MSTEILTSVFAAVGGDVSTLPDNLKTTLYEAIILQCGGTVDDLPDRLETTYLKRLAECMPAGNTGGDLDARIGGSITEVSSGVTSVGSYGLAYCNQITSVNLPNATKLDQGAFYSCSKLININVPNVKNIGNQTFYGCHKLTAVDFPKLTYIDRYSFAYCYLINTIILRSETVCRLYDKNAFDGCYHILGTVSNKHNPNGDKDGYFYVPRALLSDDDETKDYRRATNWSDFASQFRVLEDYTVDGTITGALDESKI